MKKHHKHILPRGYKLTNEIDKGKTKRLALQYTAPKTKPVTDRNRNRRKSGKHITLPKIGP